jgi:protein-S-isoprenylcysteine O-methyltransferase Ste14
VKVSPKPLAYLLVALATLLGSASLLLFVAFLFLGSFHLFDLGLSPAAALAWDALLSSAFFLQHSGMVRRTFRERLEHLVPEPFHGLVFTAASSTVLVLCLALWQRVGEPIVQLDGAAGWSARALFLLAIAGLVWGVRALGSFDTFGVGSVLARVRGIRPPQPPFAIEGPYRLVRHPLYFFVLVLFWSCPVVTSDRILFNALWTVWVVLATVLEERDLVSHFGDAYVRYQHEVPMIFPWRIPTKGRPVRR